MASGPREFCVLGLGRFGTAVAETLVELGHTVLGVDRDLDRVEHEASILTHAIQLDATDESALKEIGWRNFDTVVVSLGPDQEQSILVTVLMKEMGVKRVVAKARSPLHGKVLERVGADRVVYPEREMGVRVAHRIASPSIVDILQLSEELSVVEVMAPASMTGKTLKELELRARFGLTVLAIKRGETLISLVGPDSRLSDGDVIVIAGNQEDMTEFETHLEG